MSNWHYNGCPPARILVALLRSAQLCIECIEPAATKSRGYNWNFCIVSPFALICLEPETMQPFFLAISWTWRTPLESEGKPLWLYEVIAIIVAHTQKTFVNTIVVHLVWRRETFHSQSLLLVFSPSHAKNKCNLLLPICQKRKGEKRKKRRSKREDKSQIAQSQCMCYKFQEKMKNITSPKII